MEDSHVENVSAFGFYKPPKVKSPAVKAKARNKKIKSKFDDLCNKKKKGKKVALKRRAVQSNGVEDWSVRRLHFNDLQKNGQSKQSEQEEDSRVIGKRLLQWVLHPRDVDQVMSKFWEKRPFHISRKKSDYYSKVLSIKEVDRAFKDQRVEYTTNVDVTRYRDGKRETLNPAGRAVSADIWEFYNIGCSIRFLNPHLFFPEIYKLNATLQEYFSCMVGSNVYLTPPNSQGFAPHYDDIEALVLQVEGKKRWRVYAPRSSEEVLPRVSSKNFDECEIGSPVLDIILEPGDLLYFPRGFIHQANTVEGFHSLHVTLSTYQKNSWADLMEILLPGALALAVNENVEFRRGIPLNTSQLLGAAHSNVVIMSTERAQLLNGIRSMCKKVLEKLPIDDAVDQLQKKFQHDALPPILSGSERSRSAQGPHCKTKKGLVQSDAGDFTTTTQFRLLRANILRMVDEEGEVRLYYHSDNSRFYHEYEPVFLELESDMVPAVEELIRAYPEYVSAKKGEDDAEAYLNVFIALWSRGLVVVRRMPTN